MTNLIYRGDTYPINVSWFLPDIENPYAEDDAVISAATVRVVRLRDNATLVLDEPATVDGNDTLYLVSGEVTRIVSDYRAFVTAEFNDGTTLTQRIDFTVSYRR